MNSIWEDVSLERLVSKYRRCQNALARVLSQSHKGSQGRHKTIYYIKYFNYFNGFGHCIRFAFGHFQGLTLDEAYNKGQFTIHFNNGGSKLTTGKEQLNWYTSGNYIFKFSNPAFCAEALEFYYQLREWCRLPKEGIKPIKAATHQAYLDHWNKLFTDYQDSEYFKEMLSDRKDLETSILSEGDNFNDDDEISNKVSPEMKLFLQEVLKHRKLIYANPNQSIYHPGR